MIPASPTPLTGSPLPIRPLPNRLARALRPGLKVLALPLAATLLAGASMTAVAQSDATPTPAPRVYPLDWVPEKEVPPALRDAECEACGGRYIDPLANTEAQRPPEESDINAEASSTELQGDDVYLRGGVAVKQGYRRLRGEEAYYNRSEGAGTLTGGIRIREPGILLQGREASFSSDTGEAEIEGSEFVLHQQHIRGAAERLRRDAEGLVHIEDGELTYCAPGDHDWLIRADDMELDLQEGLGTARGAKVELGGVPVIYLPWLRFPLDDRRRTGFLWPDVGSDSRGGVDIATPVYFNLAPNYDALYTPRYIQDRGFNHEIALRYQHPYVGSWAVGGAFLGDDDRYKQERPDLDDHDRWLGKVQHRGLFDQRWRSLVDYSKASDVDYLKDLQTTNLATQRETSLLQLGSLDYLGDDWLVGMDFQQFQSLADDIREDYKKLPQITGQYRGDRTPFELDPIALAQYSYFDSDDDRVTGQRLYAETGVTYPMLWQFGFLRPTAKYRYLEYELEDLTPLQDDDNPSAGSALASLDAGLVFERPTRLLGRGLLQTLEPRAFYLYSEYEDQSDQPDFDSAELTFSYNQLFRETRFSGRDRLDDANQLALGLTTRYISDEDGREYLNASLGQIFYFDDRQVRLGPRDPVLDQASSEMAADANFYPNERVTLRSSLVWDPATGNMNAGNMQAGYRRDDGSVFNVGYSYRRPLAFSSAQPVTEQVNLSAYLPLNARWSVFGAINYSVEADTPVEDLIGIEYDTCCWKVRLLHLRYFDTVPGQNTDFTDPNLEREYSTQVQFILKGMGGFGNRVTDLLQDMIRGFEEREY